MPTNKELKTEILSLSEHLGIEVETDGKTNEDLVKLASDLRAKKRDADLSTDADGKEPEKPDASAAESASKTETDESGGQAKEGSAPPDAEEDTPAPPPGYYVTEGRSVTTVRGIIAEGAEVTASDFSGGEETLTAFTEKGILIHVA